MKKYFIYSSMFIMMLAGLSCGLTFSVHMSFDFCGTVGTILAVISFGWAVTNLIIQVKKGD